MPYRALNVQTSMEYVKSAGLFPAGALLESREIGDGNINQVFQIRSVADRKSLILKQALPYVRCVGESWPLDVSRTAREANALRIQGRWAPGLVPELIHSDDEMALIVMEDLSHLGVMRSGMIRMNRYPEFADHISTFLANLAFYTSDLYLSSQEKKLLVRDFINPELCQMIEDLTFTDPYYDCHRNRINPALRPYLEAVFWKKPALRLEASKLKYKFLTEAQSLVHADLHIGSIFADSTHTKAFDPEFAFVGPSAFDSGALIGNLFINYISWDGKEEPQDRIRGYREYLIQTANEIYGLFESKFRANWERDSRDLIACVPGYRENYARNLFVDTIGFASIVMIRRMHGLAHNIDVDGIENTQRRKDVQVKTLEMAELLMMNRLSFASIRDVTGFLRSMVF